MQVSSVSVAQGTTRPSTSSSVLGRIIRRQYGKDTSHDFKISRDRGTRAKLRVGEIEKKLPHRILRKLCDDCIGDTVKIHLFPNYHFPKRLLISYLDSV